MGDGNKSRSSLNKLHGNAFKLGLREKCTERKTRSLDPGADACRALKTFLQCDLATLITGLSLSIASCHTIIQIRQRAYQMQVPLQLCVTRLKKVQGTRVEKKQ